MLEPAVELLPADGTIFIDIPVLVVTLPKAVEVSPAIVTDLNSQVFAELTVTCLFTSLLSLTKDIAKTPVKLDLTQKLSVKDFAFASPYPNRAIS